jgi:hypothetical protein
MGKEKSSCAAESRAVKAVEEVAASKAWERLQEKLEEGGEGLVNTLELLRAQSC